MSPAAGRVVVGTDGSEAATRAVQWAAAEASRSGAALEIHTAYPSGYEFATEEDVERGTDRVLWAAEEAARAVAPGIEVTTHVHKGAPAASLIEAAEGAALLVVGTRGRGGFKQLVLGSVSNQCAIHSPCAVVIVR